MLPLVALEDQPGFPEAFASAVQRTAGQVCRRCGLEAMGHGPESKWLGHEAHGFDGVSAGDDALARARELTSEAYKRRDGM